MAFPKDLDREGKPMIDPSRIQKFGPKRLQNSCNATRFRYDEKGKAIFVKRGKPKPAIFPDVVRDVKAKFAEGAALGLPAAPETRQFDIAKLRPLRNKVLLKWGRDVERAGDVIIPEKYRQKDTIHQITAIGACDRAPDFAVGDLVALDRTAGSKAIVINKDHFVIVHINSIALIAESDCVSASKPSNVEQ